VTPRKTYRSGDLIGRQTHGGQDVASGAANRGARRSVRNGHEWAHGFHDLICIEPWERQIDDVRQATPRFAVDHRLQRIERREQLATKLRATFSPLASFVGCEPCSLSEAGNERNA
jgi:hypothetical protein